MEKTDNKLNYFPQLDALRALAVMLVIISHWFPKEHLLNKYTPNGFFGVTIFFVLSGFLITRILLNYRFFSDNAAISKSKLIKLFYIRRSLRIFPVYYITLLIVGFLNIGNIREFMGWHLSYTSNFLFFLDGMKNAAAHLWTLAVEEQFYLLWPVFILYLPKKHILSGIILVTISAVIFRFGISLLSSSKSIYILTPSCLDAFGLGALFAYAYVVHGSVFAAKFPVYLKFFVLASCLFFLYILLTLVPGENIFLRPEMIVFGRLFFSFFGLYLIYLAVNGFQGFWGKVLENPVIKYIGKISYSLYLFHYFLPPVLKYFNIEFQFSLLNISIQLFILLILSSASWYLLEKPILKQKKRFTLAVGYLPKAETITTIS